MPFKNEKISYGHPHQLYPKDVITEALKSLKDVIKLEKEPVAINFLFTKKDYDDFPAEEINGKVPYCVMVKMAVLNGKLIKSTLKHHACDGGTTALGLEPSTEEIESGRTYFSYNLYSSVSVARRLRSKIRSLHREPVSTYGIAITPLSKATVTPDVILAICNAYQVMRILQGYEYFSGVKPNIDMGGMQAICSEATVTPYQTGELNVSVLCPSTRMLCKWSESDMAVGIPFELFKLISDGVQATVMEY